MLRLMTLNLNYRGAKHGAWEARRVRVADAIRRVQADVVALQAVERANGFGLAAELAALLGYEYVSFVAATKNGAMARGSAFIGRRRFADVAARHLTQRGGHDDSDRRMVLKTSIDTRGGPVQLYNAHFSWAPLQANDNAKEALDCHSPGPALLLGDLNSTPDSPALQTLRRSGWDDLWASLRPDDPGATFEADQPSVRIDYVLASPEIRRRVHSIERVAADSDKPPRLSDHLGLVVTLRDA